MNDGNKKFDIQSALDLSTEKKMKQEENSLTKINDGFKKIIIVKGYKTPFYNEDGILIVGLYNFLMNASIIEK